MSKVFCGDSLVEMKSFEDKEFDLCLTDPPYNAKNIGPHQRVYSQGIMQLTDEQYKKFCRDWFKEAERISRSLIFTPGISNTHNYPQPFWQICWYKPAAVSFNRMGGFNAWEPIFCYGEVTKAKIGQDFIKVNVLNFSKGLRENHPCPKPPLLWRWLIEHFSKIGDSIIDPFLGSGTTAKCCAELNRECVGIDINEDYIEKICKPRMKEIHLELFSQPTKRG
jgi:DNA modification methylase